MATTPTTPTAKDMTGKSSGPQWYRVRSSFPIDQKRVLFRSVSQRRAEQWLMNRFPRGEEAYLETPSGQTSAYVVERQGEHGTDADPWQPFDPETWLPPAEQEPPGQDQWTDVES